jgi:hypothetical protein
MKTFSKSLPIAAALAALSSASASSQTAPQIDGDYKGTLVCAQLLGQATVLRVPMDITVSNNTIRFARPFLNGRQEVTGSEMADGPIDGTSFSMTSKGNEGVTRYEGKYTGSLTAADGGTFTGTQTWSAADVIRTRTCTGAFVKSRL